MLWGHKERGGGRVDNARDKLIFYNYDELINEEFVNFLQRSLIRGTRGDLGIVPEFWRKEGALPLRSAKTPFQ